MKKAPTAPVYGDLPEPRARTIRGGGERQCIEIELEWVTPILGGGPRTRKVCQEEPVRAPSIRGSLRYWWRALNACRFDSAVKLFEAERAVWGGVGSGADGVVRSPVEVSVAKCGSWNVDRSDPNNREVTFYALWVARKEKGRPPAERWEAGGRSSLQLSFPSDLADEVVRTVRAWIAFGGYGSRTRRGLGSLTVIGPEKSRWLPDSAESLADEFLSPQVQHSPGDTPVLAGATLYAARAAQDSGERSWRMALQWLRDFRQGGPHGEADDHGGHARVGPEPYGRSNWPEADKLRHLMARTPAKTPRYNRDPAWPRASFGLPIPFQFRDRGDPDDVQLTWFDAANQYQSSRSDDGVPQMNRLASPLTVKPLALADGSFVPIALWMNRAFPEGGRIGIAADDPERTLAPFRKIVGEGEEPLFQALRDKESIRQAFFDWLENKKQARRCTP